MFKFYIYVYLNPLKNGIYTFGKLSFNYEPFYIGKGKGYRYKEHLLEIRKNRDNNHLKNNILNKIKNENKEPIIIKLYDNITENSAFRLEKYLIRLIGRRDLDLGNLSNMSDGGEGSSGAIYSLEKRLNMCSVKDKIVQYNTDGNIIKIWDNIVDISINNITYRTNNIHRACKSKGSRKYDNYLWKYHESEKINDIIPILDKYKKVLQYDLNGDFIKEWENSNQVNKETGIDAVLQCCKKNNKYLLKYKYKDFMWYFKKINFNLNIGSYNINSASGNGFIKNKNIKMYDLNGNYIDILTPRELKNKGFLVKTIYRCCNNKMKKSQGYKWKWE